MKKALIFALIIGLIAGSMAAPATAKKKKKKKPVKIERVAQGTYAAPATAAGNCTQTDGVGCMTIQSGAGERYVTAKVTDATGQPVAVTVDADLDGDAQTETSYGTFCGETTEPIEIEPGAALVFWVGGPLQIVAAGCTPGVGTQGTLDVTFSNLP